MILYAENSKNFKNTGGKKIRKTNSATVIYKKNQHMKIICIFFFFGCAYGLKSFQARYSMCDIAVTRATAVTMPDP